jgi:hypothetical protein
VHYIVVTDHTIRHTLAGIATNKVLWAPVTIVCVYDKEFGVTHNAAMTSLGAGFQNLALAATALNLATCPMAGFQNDALIKKLLLIPERFEVALLIGLGYPATLGRERQRLPFGKQVHYNSFSAINPIIPLKKKLSAWTLAELADYRGRLAPVYRYGTRSSLNIYDPELYRKVATMVVQNIPSEASCLDLFTYDGLFHTYMAELRPDVLFTVSDITPYTLDVYHSDKTTLVQKIDDDYSLGDTQKRYQAVTVVFKLEFTPNPYRLLLSATSQLELNGALYVAIEVKSLFRRMYDFWINKIKPILNREPSNVYENNPYYKVGLRQEISTYTLDQWCKKLGYKEEESKFFNFVSGKGIKRVYYAVYKKI